MLGKAIPLPIQFGGVFFFLYKNTISCSDKHGLQGWKSTSSHLSVAPLQLRLSLTARQSRAQAPGQLSRAGPGALQFCAWELCSTGLLLCSFQGYLPGAQPHKGHLGIGV